MQAFEYTSPTSLKDALAMLGTSGDAAVLAGGTDLISLMKDYVASPKRVVNIKGIKELGGVGIQKGMLRIGATATFDEIAGNAAVRKDFAAIADAVLGVTSPQIRNMGTAGGDVCQRPRCWYFRNGFGLLATDKGKALVPSGENRYHAIFSNSGPAYFVSASSLGPALVAMNAKIAIASAKGNREVEASKFFVTPKAETEREVALAPGEIVTAILIPSGMKSSTYEVRQKAALDWPLAAASVALKMKGSTVEMGSVALGHVAPTPYHAAHASSLLAGKTITDSVAEEIAAAAVAGATPLSQNAYKVQLAKVAVKRALLAAAQA